jgi:hypothetical protein
MLWIPYELCISNKKNLTNRQITIVLSTKAIFSGKVCTLDSASAGVNLQQPMPIVK